MGPENYGMERDGDRPVVSAPGGMSAADERSWSALAHLSTFLNLFTGFLGPVAAFIVWLAYRGRSGVVAYHAMRSVVYQAIWLAVLSVGWTVTFFLLAFVVGIVLVPVMGLLTLAFFGQGALEAYRAYHNPRREYL